MAARTVGHRQTIARELVHKWSIDEVFITDFEPISDDRMALGTQLPRAHGFYCEYPLQNRQPDLALLVEVCRQACFVVAHEQFGVPVEGNNYQFLFQELDAELVSERTLDTTRPVNAVVTSTVERVWKRGNVFSGLLWRFVVQADEEELAVIRIRMTWIERTKWREMRLLMRRSRSLPLDLKMPDPPTTSLTPQEVGRVNPENIVLAGLSYGDEVSTATVRADIAHPVLFDHPIDHIYGMVQLEAARQLAVATLSMRTGTPASAITMTACATSFTSVAEFDLPTELRARIGTTDDPGKEHLGTPLTIEVSQQGRVVSRFDLRARLD
ncbi:AfsA-related hotdog domain-containing protein [Streptomyces antimycoticus]|uniref:AfsA-related hotdog domain-containing protein n=1 Tax=Streptomyces antimycoticus TaxID=68175 RepID=UPI00342136CD